MSIDKYHLHYIFRYLVNDKNFLKQVIIDEVPEEKKVEKSPFVLMDNVVSEHSALAPYEIQKYSLFPMKIKIFLNHSYQRHGIKNMIDKNLSVVNISFLHSLNILLRNEISKMDLNEQIKNLNYLETFLIHKISKNYHIDKVKNTKKNKKINENYIMQIQEGKITHNLIQVLVNIFEINLVVFDFIKSESYLYWTAGTKYPYFNLCKNIYFMSYIHGNYEPIFPEKEISSKEMCKIYVNILNHAKEFKQLTPIKLDVISLEILNGWNIAPNFYVKILENFFLPEKLDDSFLVFLDKEKKKLYRQTP